MSTCYCVETAVLSGKQPSAYAVTLMDDNLYIHTSSWLVSTGIIWKIQRNDRRLATNFADSCKKQAAAVFTAANTLTYLYQEFKTHDMQIYTCPKSPGTHYKFMYDFIRKFMMKLESISLMASRFINSTLYDYGDCPHKLLIQSPHFRSF